MTGPHRTAPRLLVAAFCLVVAAPLLPAGAQDAPPTRRVSGDNRYATASAVARDTFPQGAATVFVATGQAFPDALAAVPLAVREHGPVLLVTRTSVPGATDRALDDLNPSQIVLFGGTSAVSDAVMTALGEHAPVTRVSGTNRYATAAQVAARYYSQTGGVVHVASGASFADALAAGPPAGVAQGPILLVQRTQVPAATAAELQRLQPRRIVVAGGHAAVSNAVVDELGRYSDDVVRRDGRDRYDTAVRVSAAAFQPTRPRVYLATGADYPDALSGGVAAGVAEGPVLLTPPTCVPQAVRAEIDRLGAQEVVLLGGQQALSDDVRRLSPCGRQTRVIADGLQIPWSVAFAPDGSAYISERDTGRVLRRATDGRVTEVQRISVNNQSEGGLLGLAASPQFADDGLLYSYITTNSDNRVIRFRPGQSPSNVLTGIPRAGIHNGGRIAFGPDGMLYIATGDAGQANLAQDRSSLAGKILRVTPNGQVPSGNPFSGSPVWSYGHRNVQGLAWDSANRMYATEFGPDRDDEINRIVPGGNYGWPEVTGAAGREGFIDPIVVRQPPEASWSGAAILQGSSIPEWEGSLFAAGLRGQRLWRFDLRGGEVTGAEQLLRDEFGRLRDVVQAPDGSVWVLSNNRSSGDVIVRIGPGS